MSKIIIIEDDLMIRENMIEILKEHFYDAKGFEDGNLALEEIFNSPPELIICDIMMPKKSGYEIIEKLKSNSITNTIPFIFVTAKAELSDTRKGMDMGADDYLIKPFTIKELLTTINTRFEEKKNEKKNLENKLSEKLDALKTITSHEYNTPLNGIVGFTDLLITSLDNFEKDVFTEYLNAIKISAKRLMKSNKQLVKIIDILAIDKPLQPNIITINELQIESKKIISKIEAEYLRFNIVAFEEIPTNNTLYVAFPSMHLFSIIEEMIENAFKFSFKESLVKIKYKIENNYFLTIEILNTSFHPFNCNSKDIFLNSESCINGDSSFKSGLFILNKLCEINNCKFKITQNHHTVSSSIKLKCFSKKKQLIAT